MRLAFCPLFPGLVKSQSFSCTFANSQWGAGALLFPAPTSWKGPLECPSLTLPWNWLDLEKGSNDTRIYKILVNPGSSAENCLENLGKGKGKGKGWAEPHPGMHSPIPPPSPHPHPPASLCPDNVAQRGSGADCLGSRTPALLLLPSLPVRGHLPRLPVSLSDGGTKVPVPGCLFWGQDKLKGSVVKYLEECLTQRKFGSSGQQSFSPDS